MFFSSHFRHHRYTQNYPQDQENPPPIRYRLKDFLLFAFVNGMFVESILLFSLIFCLQLVLVV
jgi:fatty acid desaturase